MAGTNQRGSSDLMFRLGTGLFGLLVIVTVVAIGFELARQSMLSIQKFGLSFWLTDTWDPVAGQFGARPFIWGTLYSSVLAMMLAVPISIGIAVFISELAPARFQQPLVNSAFTLALVTGMTVPDTSENAAANLAWTDIKLPKPVYVGDTLYAESEITDKRESKSNPSVGIVSMRCRGLNQRGEVVIEFKRTFMVYKRDAPEVTDTFPKTDEPWTV